MTETTITQAQQLDMLKLLASTFGLEGYLRDPVDDATRAFKLADELHNARRAAGVSCCMICSHEITELKDELIEKSRPKLPPHKKVLTKPGRKRGSKKVHNPPNSEHPTRAAGRQRVKNRVDKWRAAKDGGESATVVAQLKEDARKMRDWYNAEFGGNVYPDLF